MKKHFFAGAVFLFALLAVSPVFAADKKSSNAQQEMLARRQKVQLMSFFLKDPKDAELPTAPMGVELLNQAVVYYQKNEFELAKQALKDSLAQDDLNPYAYELLGDIYNNEQNLKEAKSNYEIAYNLQPTESLKGKIETLGKEAVAEKKLSTYNEEHFIIKYQNQERSMEGFELREILRLTYRNVSQDLGHYFKHKVVVLLLDEEDFKQITNLPHWIGGVYDGKIRMPVKKIFSENELKALTAHEVTHAFVAVISGQRAPSWINEGLAQYEENKIRPLDLLVFNAAVKTKSLMPLDQLMNQSLVMEQQDPLWASLFYQQSFHLTQYLVKRHGMFALKKMLLEFASGKNSDEAIRNVLGISVSRLEKEWRDTFIK